ncbi:MAG: hypothetical protein PQ612_06710 [Rickettsiales bacterium]|nr:hypothetical protein [Pseudomonadota bacterium]MDA0966665.1 hypothetical protein [Pseudomonadota bacterium]MDG4543693.1 hypothetical protein [Rickettsiales bacterium]MDG4545840.1 hypothetical protein [Rickettsiales bacterium]MDG4547386.1 hypothetical protein [Rickettsiales bacterium]
MRDLHNNIKAETAFNTSAISSDTTTNGNIIDMQGFGSIEFVIQSGTLTDGTYTPLIQEGDESNLSDATAVGDADLLGTEADAAFIATEDNAVKKIGYIGNKRYVRLSIVSASTTSGGTISAVSVKSDAGDMPVM